MEKFQKKFLSDSIERLQKLLSEINQRETLPNDLKQELLRTFHTTKGITQVLGLKTASELAHHLEDLVSDKEIKILREKIKLLIEVLEGKDILDKTGIQKFEEKEIEPEILPIVENLFPQERKSLSRAVFQGKNILIASKEFKIENFAVELNSFQSKIRNYAENIACLSERTSDGLKLHFILATDRKIKELSDLKKELSDLKIERFLDGELLLIINRVIAHGKEISSQKKKQVKFEFQTSVMEFPKHLAEITFTILIHLVRNSVDHGLSEQGKVKIQLNQVFDKLILKVSDDGQGIDLQKIKKKAIEKGIISQDKKLSEQETLNLIFTHGFSTADIASKTSGRGVGLDIIKQKIEQNGGKIRVESYPNKGTSFEIIFNLLDLKN
jgi:two-component system chemotaxis sensor kinase CheA